MKCQRQIMKIRWQDHMRNTEVALLTGLCPVLDLITRRRNVVFGHIARLSEDTPAHQALRCHVDISRTPSWSRLEASSGPPKQPMDWPGQQQHTTSWFVEAIHHARSFGGDATVLADYTLMTTRPCSHCLGLVLKVTGHRFHAYPVHCKRLWTSCYLTVFFKSIQPPPLCVMRNKK